ncbi:glycoside hydrolase family 25 protein [Streptomyces sp. NPDC091215]|uniref:glycoside hydrolase family 25 protein n=1 Tax=Streptomyces sp. NPDC091215 TaxID=3155192 RepID=UPI0034429988
MATCRGIDVSAYQGTQDWAARKTEGVVFAMAKASEGQTSHDPKFATHIRGIIAAGLVPGSYHFAWPNQDPAREAANYIAAVKDFARAGYVHWLDLERYPDGRNYSGRTDKQIAEWAITWLAAVRTAFPGQRVGVYTSADDVAKGHLPDGVDWWYPAYPWGAAAYSRAEAAARPKVSGRQPLIWQFTSQPIDRNIAYLSAADFRAWASGSQEDTVALTADDISKVADAVFAKLAAGGGVLENSDIARIFSSDGSVPAARPPVNNDDYYQADGKTPNNVSWAAGYALQTTVEGVRKTQQAVGGVAADVTHVKTAVDALSVAGVDVDALAAKVASSTALTDTIAEKVAEKLAARLAE